MALEHVEETVFLRHDCTNETQHPVPPGESVDAHNSEGRARIECLFAPAKRQNYYAQLRLLDSLRGLGLGKPSQRALGALRPGIGLARDEQGIEIDDGRREAAGGALLLV